MQTWFDAQLDQKILDVSNLDVHLLKKKVGKLKSKCLMLLYDTISH